ncbi:MAG: hypothetical protein AMXMBFR57_16290 [Acidimicrobiia bacterium]
MMTRACLVACASVLTGLNGLSPGVNTPVSAQQRWQVESDASDIDRWVRGEWTPESVPPYSPRDFARVADTLKREGERWYRAAGPASEPLRRQQIAAFVLDVVLTQGNRVPADHGSPVIELMTWAADTLGAGDPSEAERLWRLASMAWLQRRGAGFAVFAERARARFPVEARFTLAVALSHERPQWPQARDVATWQPDQREWLRMSDAYHAAMAHSAVAAEARVRLGRLELQRGRVDDALVLLDAAQAPGDPWLQYLKHLFTGQAHERRGDLTRAEAAYAAACVAIPLAQSATIAWASALARTGRADAAAAVTTKLLQVDIPVADPWQDYLWSEWRFLDGWMGQLRSLVRP